MVENVLKENKLIETVSKKNRLMDYGPKENGPMKIGPLENETTDKSQMEFVTMENEPILDHRWMKEDGKLMDYNYLCTCKSFSPVHNGFHAGKSITSGVGPWNSRYLWAP